jgi:hypothetical protein
VIGENPPVHREEGKGRSHFKERKRMRMIPERGWDENGMRMGWEGMRMGMR